MLAACNNNENEDVEEKKEEIDYDNKDGFDNYLFRTMYAENKDPANMILSPFSILTAMTICMLGSANNTLKQMLNVLYPNIANKQLTFDNSTKITADIVEICKYYNSKYDGKDDKQAIIKIANKIWINKGFDILDKYIAASQVDAIGRFDAKQANEAATQINNWCAEQTNNLIKEIVDASVMSQTELVIANAIYFNGKFSTPFDKNKTMPNAPFYANKDKKKEIGKVALMRNVETFTRAERVNDIYDVVKLSYKSDEKLSLILAINNYSEDENVALLTTKDILNMKWKKEKIDLRVPKFKFEFKIKLNNVLKNMGIIDAFDNETADFSNMSERKLKIDQVIHKAVIEVDEKGTEAAAVTGITMSLTSFVQPPVVRFDHPFQFFIFDDEKKMALFTGLFVNK